MSQNPVVFIATPCFGGMVTKDYMNSVISLMQVGAANNIQFLLAMLGNDALITRSRNTLVSSFLNETSATHMLFIDADISFEPDAILRLLRSDKDVAGAMYPIKDYDWDQTSAGPNPGETFAQSAMRYVGTPISGRNAEWDGALTTAYYIGTGMMLIKRAVVEKLIAAYPDLRYTGIHAFHRDKRPQLPQYALFECLIDNATGLYLSEDYAFCERWRRIGGKLWLDTEIQLTHTGPYRFAGNPALRFQAAMPQALSLAR